MRRIVQKRVDFPGAFGNRIAARLDLPSDDPRAFVLFAHCFTCTKDLKAARRLARALAELGLGVLRFDFTGLGESEGEFADTDFSSNVEDLVSAAAFLRQEFAAPQLLVGHSLGGTAMLVAAARIPESVAVATSGTGGSTPATARTARRPRRRSTRSTERSRYGEISAPTNGHDSCRSPSAVRSIAC